MKGVNQSMININKVTAVFFSPTHGSERYAKAIAKEISAEFEVLDLTRPDARRRRYEFKSDELVIFGAPVYAGRLPSVEGGIFDNVFGNDTPAVFTVSYGNRAYEDALLEEKNICEANGFKGIAAGAWIAPHTYSDKIAAGRPDSDDLKKVSEFAGKIKEIVLNKNLSEIGLEVPGDYPYREAKQAPFNPRGNKKCISCGKCAEVCPVSAIDPKTPTLTDAEKCIACMACAKNCPVGARGAFAPVYKTASLALESALLKTRKEPELFYCR